MIDHPLCGRRNSILCVISLFFISALMMYRQISSTGYFSVVNDATFSYTSWAWQFTEAFQSGIVYPRWMPLDFAGYGSPTFLIYPPLAFYLTTLMSFFTGSVIVAMNIVKFFSIIISAIGIFFLAKEFYSDKSALVAASSFVILPHNVFQYYLSGGFANCISFLWFSPILLCIYRYTYKQQFSYLIYGGIFYAGLILTHIINAYMFTFIMLFFTFYVSDTKSLAKNIFALLSIISFGLIVSASYLLPLVFEKKLVDLEFNYFNWFLLPNRTYIFDSNHYWPLYYNTVVFNTAFLCLLIIIVIINKITIPSSTFGYSSYKFFLGIAAGSIFLLFGPSAFLWESIPFFKYIHIPGRWLNMTTFSVSFLMASLLSNSNHCRTKENISLFLIVMIFLVCIVVDYSYITKAPVFTTNELIPPKAINTSKDHLPANVEINKLRKDLLSNDKILVVKGTGNAKIISWKSEERDIRISANEPLTLRFRTFNFLGWKAYLDGIETKLFSESGTQAILVDVPQGQHSVKLVFTDTPIRRYGKLITFCSFILLALLLISDLLRKAFQHGS